MVISVGEDGIQEMVSWSHGDKRIAELIGPALFQFNRETMFNVLTVRVFVFKHYCISKYIHSTCEKTSKSKFLNKI